MFKLLVIGSVVCLSIFWAFLGLDQLAPLREMLPNGWLAFLQEHSGSITILFIEVLLVSGVVRGALAWNLDRQWGKVRDIMLESVKATLANGLGTLRHINRDLEVLYREEDAERIAEKDLPDHHRDVEHHSNPEFDDRVNAIIKAKLHFEDLHDDMYMMLGALQSSLNPHVAVVFANSTEAFRHVVIIARIVEVAAKRATTDDHGRSANAVRYRLTQIRQHFNAMQEHFIASTTQKVLAEQLWKPLIKEAERTADLLERHDATFDEAPERPTMNDREVTPE